MQKLFMLLLIITIFPTDDSLSSDLYKWTDEGGDVHYSNVPNQNVDENNVERETKKALVMPKRNKKIELNTESSSEKVLNEMEKEIQVTRDKIFQLESEYAELRREVNADAEEAAHCLVILEDDSTTSYYVVEPGPVMNELSILTQRNVSPYKRAYCKEMVSSYRERENELEIMYDQIEELSKYEDKLIDEQYRLSLQ